MLDYRIHELIAQKDFVTADFATSADRDWTVGSGGVVSLGATRFNLQKYKKIIFYAQGAWAGAGYLQCGVSFYDRQTGGGEYGRAYTNLTSPGGSSILVLGSATSLNANPGEYSGTYKASVLQPTWVLLHTYNDATLGAISSLRWTIYGVR